MNVTLENLEELRHFRSEESRQRALDALAASNRPRDLAMGIALTAGAGLLGALGTGYLLGHLPIRLHPMVPAVLSPMVGIACFFLTMRFLHRIGAAKALRRSLLGDGVPVCLRCGYLLRGLARDATSCPECGGAISEEARALLRDGPLPQ